MPRPAAKRARVARKDNPPPAQPAKSNATGGKRGRKAPGRPPRVSATKSNTTPKSRFDISGGAELSEAEQQNDEVQGHSSGMIRRDRERGMASSQTPVRDRHQQTNAPLSGGVGMGASLRLQAFPGSARRGDMNHRGHTPAFESSILSAFRPRPRQPSILQLVGDDSLDLGSSELGSDDLLGNFDPEDISTPLPTAMRKTLNEVDVTPTAVKKTPKFPIVTVEIPVRREASLDTKIPDEPSIAIDEAPDDPVALDEALDEPPVLVDETLDEPSIAVDEAPREPSVVEETPDEHVAVDVVDDLDDDDCSSLSSIDSLPPMSFARTQAQESQRQTMTMAPPASSQGTATPPASTPQSSASHQSNLAATRNSGTKPSKYPHLSTTLLQDALLPQRRSRRQGLANKRGKRSRAGAKDYVLSAPGSEDELNYSRAPRVLEEDTGSQQKNKKRPHNQTGSKIREKTKNAAQPKKGRGKSVAVTKSTTPKRTYSRLSKTGGDADWDKENLPEEAEVSSDREIAAPAISDELLLQKKKFAEIDEWSIDFEEVLDDDGGLY